MSVLKELEADLRRDQESNRVRAQLLSNLRFFEAAVRTLATSSMATGTISAASGSGNSPEGATPRKPGETSGLIW